MGRHIFFSRFSDDGTWVYRRERTWVLTVVVVLSMRILWMRFRGMSMVVVVAFVAMRMEEVKDDDNEDDDG